MNHRAHEEHEGVEAAPGRAMVLTAGLGTRLRPLTLVRAKPAIPVAGEPMIRRILRWLTANGIVDVVLNLHHLPETIAAVVGDGSDLAARVRYSWEQPDVLGSAGGPRLALPLIGAERFFLVNGDTLTDVNLAALADAHVRSGALVTLALVPNVEPLRYGGVLVDASGAITGFVRRGPGAGGSYHFIGVQVVEARVFAPLPAATPVNSIGGLYDEILARRPGAIRGCVCNASFWDVGTAGDYLRTSSAFAAADDAVVCGERVTIDPGARVTRSILWDDIEIASGCRLDRCIVTDRVRVPSGTSHREVVLLAQPDGRLAAFPLSDRPPQASS